MTAALPLSAADATSVRATAPLSARRKAAIIVHLVLSGGGRLSLAALPPDMQRDLTVQIGALRHVDRETLDLVIGEFITRIEQTGLARTGGFEGALSLLDGSLDPQVVDNMRKEGGIRKAGDPWDTVTGLAAERLLPVLEEESIEVSAVLLSKLPVSRAAELLGMIPGDQARRITYAISLTGAVTPDAVARIGQALAARFDSIPPRAFDDGPVERVGAILNFSPANTRDTVLEGLEKQDSEFATRVRKAIFTFENIPDRVDPRDVPKIIRGLSPETLSAALSAASASGMETSSDFILNNISKRMADSIRDEIQENGPVTGKDGEAAIAELVTEIRALETAGEIFFVAQDD
jgi:flagellar motor switch protein FliG